MDFSIIVALLVGIALGVAGVFVVGPRTRVGRRGTTETGNDAAASMPNEPASLHPAAPPASAPSAPPATPAMAPPEDVFTLATSLESLCRKSAHPRDLLENERFRRGIELVLGADRTPEALLDYMGSGKVAIACMALAALERRTEPGDVGPLTERIPSDYAQVDVRIAYFALRALGARATQPVIGRVLVHANKEWAGPLRLAFLREFVSQRLAAGEEPRFDGVLAALMPNRIDTLSTIMERLKDLLPESLREEFRISREGDDDPTSPTTAGESDAPPAGSSIDTTTLATIGRIWRRESPEASGVLTSERLSRVVAQAALSLRADPPRSIALVGEAGVGKTSLVRALAEQLQQDDWTIFEAGSVEIVAGQMYIGQLEDRLQSLVGALKGRKVLWVVPGFQDLLWAGSHKDNPSGVLDRILPHLESGEIRIIAELTPAAHERLLQSKPQLRPLLVAIRVSPADDAEALELTRQWAARHGRDGRPLLSESALREALQLATQYLTNRALPGNVLDLLNLTHRRLAAAGAAPGQEITQDDILLTLSQLTGLPLNMLDERGTLDLDGLRALFIRRVIGQPEAVDCLVERVAMMKAGVTDPTRPAGVFLFVGPTGTGKTEIAKTLAQHLFGSAERMLRLDMSELQTPESLDRILGSAGDGSESTALVNAIRRHPFSVVLLDEFEKAHPSVWDLFLQVFDDGRLTDRRGGVADFRHAVIILTSNLGATLPYGAVIGFIPGGVEFAVNSVERAVADTFRREFINRIDRVVVFRPLGRVEMREILHKELDDVFRRRGLRNRTWAVEWEVSAIDFLLDKGFTPDLGARPLKRAIERYLLAPLAATIVHHRVPAGDQFLFVRSAGDRLDVVFIDPDAIDSVTHDDALREEEAAVEPDVRHLVFEARGSREEVDFLDDRYADVADEVQSADWQQRKQGALAEMRAAGFWDSAKRFEVLGTAEYMDRIEAGLETASSLLRRLTSGSPRGRLHYPRDVVQRLAQQLYLLEMACATLAAGSPRDAYVLVRASRDSGTDHARADEFASRIGRAYLEWAKKRRMRLDVLEETPGNGATPYSLLSAVSGFGAFTILEPESGLHVLETPQDAKSFNRVKARVIVAPQDDIPVANPREARVRAARAVDARSEERAQLIVRRYREEPSPLVRDAVRQWRTGRIDRVFGGDFDVIG